MFYYLWLDLSPVNDPVSKKLDILINYYKENRGILVKRIGVPRLVLEKLIDEMKLISIFEDENSSGKNVYKGIEIYADDYMFGRHMLVTDYEKI